MNSLVFFLVILGRFLGPVNIQAVQLPGPDGLTPTERSKLEKEVKIDSRIQVYEAASTRFYKSVRSNLQKEEFEIVHEDLTSWMKVLSASLEDIEVNIDRRKMSRALIRYEIQLRKAFVDLQNLKHKAPAEEQDKIDTWLGRAEGIRAGFLNILFKR
jgi:hypothetical protein